MSTTEYRHLQKNSDRSPALLEWLPLLIALAIGVFFYSFILPPFRPYGWVDDWIYAVPLQFTTLSEWMTWLFQQHVDHRIPIQKLSNFLILKASGFDYRPLVGLNFAMGISVSCMLVDFARRYRGYFSIGDIAIPMIILNFGMGYTHWAFLFQPISLMFYFTGFLYASLIGIQGNSKTAVAVGGAFLMLTVFAGMGGALVATGAALSVIVWHFIARDMGHFLLLHYATVLIGCTILANWTAWNPGEHTPSIIAIIDYTAGLFMSAFVILTRDHEMAIKIIASGIVFIAVGILLIRIWYKRATAVEFLVGAALGIFACLALSISYGRADMKGGGGIMDQLCITARCLFTSQFCHGL